MLSFFHIPAFSLCPFLASVCENHGRGGVLIVQGGQRLILDLHEKGANLLFQFPFEKNCKQELLCEGNLGVSFNFSG